MKKPTKKTLASDGFAPFRAKLLRLCDDHGSQRQFAMKFGISTVQLNRLVKGWCHPSTAMLMRLADYTGKSISELV